MNAMNDAFLGASQQPAKPGRPQWDLPPGVLHWTGYHAAALQTGPAGPGTGGIQVISREYRPGLFQSQAFFFLATY